VKTLILLLLFFPLGRTQFAIMENPPHFIAMGKSIPKEIMHDPESYVDKKMDKYDTLLSDASAFLSADKDNFIILKSDITRVYNNPKKKFGMGYYPQSGRIEIETAKSAGNFKGNRELILVGDQKPDVVLGLFR
jgi:hypothetical protein